MNLYNQNIEFGYERDGFIRNLVSCSITFKTYSGLYHRLLISMSKELIDHTDIVQEMIKDGIRDYLTHTLFKKQFNTISRLKMLSK